jgi:hypothetical protein
MNKEESRAEHANMLAEELKCSLVITFIQSAPAHWGPKNNSPPTDSSSAFLRQASSRDGEDMTKPHDTKAVTVRVVVKHEDLTAKMVVVALDAC